MLRRLAIGRTSDVLLACENDGEPFVAKRFRAREADTGPFDAALTRAAKSYSQVSHPCVARLQGVFPSGDQLVVMRDYIDGLSLRQLSALLKWTGLRHDAGVALYIGEQVFCALAAAHAADVVHGNLHPANVLLSWDGRVHVTDFCLGWASRGLSHTPSKRADVFAASVMLWEILSGEHAREIKVRPESVSEIDADSPVCEALRFGVDRGRGQPWLSAELMSRAIRGSVKEDRARALLVMALDEVRPAPASEAPDSSRADRVSSSMAAYAMTEAPESERASPLPPSRASRPEIAGRPAAKAAAPKARVARKRPARSSAPPPR